MTRYSGSDLLIVGGGGQATMVIDILLQQRTFTIVGIVDQKDRIGHHLADIPIIGYDSSLEELRQKGLQNALVAIGDNNRRAQLYQQLKKLGYEMINAIHASAIISTSAHISRGTVIMPGAIVNANCLIKENVIINTKATIDHDCVIMEHSHISPGCTLTGGVTVSTGAMLGAGTTVIPGVCIGEWSVIGAGSVVVSPIPERTVAYGVPAKIIRYLE